MFSYSYRCLPASLLLFAALWSPSDTEAALVYAVTGGRGGAAPSTLYTVDTVTGNATRVGGPAAQTGVSQITGLAFDPKSGVLYGHQNYPDLPPGGPLVRGTLHTIDLSTGLATAVGETESAITDISFHSSGQLYGWMNGSQRTGFTSLSDKLVTIDKTTGTFSLVENQRASDIPSNQSGLAFTPDDRLFLKSGEISKGKPKAEWVGRLHSINQTTVAAAWSVDTSPAPISTLTAISNDFAMTIVRDVNNDGNVISLLATIDLRSVVPDGTPDGTPNMALGAMNFGAEITENGNSLIITALAVPVSVPEPNAVLLLALGSARLLARRRR